MGGAKHYWELRAWQTVRAFKLGIYDLVERGPVAHDARIRDQLREASAAAQSHISEGYGRFDPLDFARFVKMSLASMIECGLLDYLQSPEAKQNAARLRQKRNARRQLREDGTPNAERRTSNDEP